MAGDIGEHKKVGGISGCKSKKSDFWRTGHIPPVWAYNPYCLTRLDRSEIAAACSVTRFNIVPAMAATH